MIFVDANTFLRYLVLPATPQDHNNAQHAAAMFALTEAGEVEFTTSEAILAEVAFILTNPRHYGAERATAAAGLKALLQSRAFRMPAKEVALHALDVWVANPRLSFPDALAAAYSALRGYLLATFDAALVQTPGVTPYAFD